ncbi:glycoside hydrolase family 78 protein [Sinomicrobium kalidii]|uniref:glycoside hydrolase family 78 protein n=1 Tax=Sinomicrobium kalidii TaxID=2900738 RepID=UPI001E55E346|nr:glycoside hydrolase family 78 protein [Sinomicrobium kalidii]UGU15764.1 glycoside hydrolase family 78 protein [Sinomicrobium kalidii]
MKTFYRHIITWISLILLISGCSENKRIPIKAVHLTCEAAVNPVGITAEQPRLGWQLESEGYNIQQETYHIQVASSKAGLREGEADIWDSREVGSGESQWISYKGKALKRGKRYFWKVRVTDNHGNTSPWSEINSWFTAPGKEELDARWIGAIRRENSHLPEGRKYHTPTFKREKRDSIIAAADSMSYRSIMLRKAFSARKKIKHAMVFISGLGQYELTVNGEKIGDSEFAPLWSDYDKTVYYNIYDVKDKLNQGENAIGVMLGNGMYNTLGGRYSKFFVSFGPPTLFLKMKIQYEDGTEETVRSDSSWKYARSPVVFNSIFGGEDYDARLEQPGWDRPGFEDSKWKPVVVQESPKGKLRAQTAPPVKTLEEYTVKHTDEPRPGTYVLDMGQNLSGFPAIKVKGKKGQTIRIWVGESLKDDGTVAQGGSGKPYYYEYTLKGREEETWQPRFSYYGFQYIQLEGANYREVKDKNRPVVSEVKSLFVYNSAGNAGSFECSNDIFNRTHELINNAVKSNFHSVFTDCPHREKLGWLEETHLNGPGLLYNYRLQNFIPKIMQDIADAQRENGLIPNIAPEYIVFGGDFTDSPEWGVAGVVLPWMYYEYYGDPSLIEKYYDVMKKYVDYLTSTSENHIVSHGLGDWYDYGEHPAGYSKNSPIALSATSHYFMGAKLVAKAARLLDKKEDVSKYETLTENIRAAFNREFFDKETRQYGTGSQFSNAVPLFMEITEPEYRDAVLDNLLADIKKRGYRLTTGDVGNRYLYQVLARNGQNDIMYKLHNHYDTPGYGFQIKFGLTTLTEQWDPRKGNSLNHFMMGQIEEWFYQSLAGIVPDKQNPGFRHFFLQPRTVGDMTHVKASYKSVYGNIRSEWSKEGDKLRFTFEIPANTTATIKLPVSKNAEVVLNGKALNNSDLVPDIEKDSKSPVFRLGSGIYKIECNNGHPERSRGVGGKDTPTVQKEKND